MELRHGLAVVVGANDLVSARADGLGLRLRELCLGTNDQRFQLASSERHGR